MLIVRKLPNVSAQSRAFISGRSKNTWHGDLYTQTGAGGTAVKNVGGKIGGCVCFTKPMWSLGLNIWGGYNEEGMVNVDVVVYID